MRGSGVLKQLRILASSLLVLAAMYLWWVGESPSDFIGKRRAMDSDRAAGRIRNRADAVQARSRLSDRSR